MALQDPSSLATSTKSTVLSTAAPNLACTTPASPAMSYLQQEAFSDCLCDASLVAFDLHKCLYGDSSTQEECLVKALKIHFEELRLGLVKASVVLEPLHCRPTPIGPILHGGTSLALAESVAGVASVLLCNCSDHPVGVSVTGNHVSMARLGQKLTLNCSLVYQGSSCHLWNVDIQDEKGVLVSTIRVTNAIIKGKKQ